ncbi:MAG: polysaccharide biosynthesis/export family protein [Bacteroidia bacterium]
MKNFETRLKADDLLSIIVSSEDFNSLEAAIPFNLSVGSTPSTGGETVMPGETMDYLIDKDGFINFPSIGKVKAGGLVKEEFEQSLKGKLSKFLNKPLITVRIKNFRISVVGEVLKPGFYNIPTERVSIPEALAMAGDLTIFGLRENVLLIRDNNGVKTHVELDLTDGNLINSEYFYLQQNDALYIKQNKAKRGAGAIGPSVPIIVSALSVLAVVVSLIIR